MHSRDAKNIIIVGAGLAGLVAVIECINHTRQNQDKFFNLHIIEKRSLDFNRRQKLIITNLNEFKFGDFPAVYWQQFCEKNFDPYGEIKIKFNNYYKTNNQAYKSNNQREKFLYKLWRQTNYYYHELRDKIVYKNFSIKELQFALYEHIQHSNHHNILINWHTQATIKDIQPTKNELIIQYSTPKNTISIKYDNIIIAEGSKKEVTHLINQTFNHPFTFKRFTFPTLYHASARLKLKLTTHCNSQDQGLFRGNSKFSTKFKLAYPNEYSESKLLKKFQSLGYTKNIMPNFYVIDDNFYKYKNGQDDLRLFVVSEIPKSIYCLASSIKKREAIILWSKLIAAMAYHVSDEYFEFDAKGETQNSQLNALAFANKLKYAETPVLELPANRYIYLVGDAAISNYYPLGFSSVIAATEAAYVSRLVCSNNYAYKSYSQLCQYYRVFIANSLEKDSDHFSRDFKGEFQSEQQKYSVI